MTNNTLGARGGSEVYILDLAKRLRRRGHAVVAYSSMLGTVADELRANGIATIDDLSLLTEAPDVIHGQHHLESAAACLHFPQVPAVHACHGWLPWQETPLATASVRRFVAVSELTREYLVTSGIAPDRITVIPNFVDLSRFKSRRKELNTRRALVYGNGWTADAQALKFIRAVCARAGFTLDAVGYGLQNPTDSPEDLLPSFDVVFALGRSALEAMACGCAVIVAEPGGMDGLVTPDTFDRQQRGNFGLACTAGKPVSEALVEAAISQINVQSVQDVTALVADRANIEHAVDSWETIYRTVVAEGPVDIKQTVAGAARFSVQLRKTVGHFETDLQSTHSALRRMEQAQHEAQLEANWLKQERDDLKIQLVASLKEIEQIRSSTSWRITRPLRAIAKRIRRHSR